MNWWPNLIAHKKLVRFVWDCFDQQKSNYTGDYTQSDIWNVKAGNQIIRTTAGHPFHVKGRGWIKVQDLRIGDKLRTAEEKWVGVVSVTDTGRSEPVFNLCVETSHTFWVRDGEGPTVLVHNQSATTQPARADSTDDPYVPVQTIIEPDGTQIVIRMPASAAATQPDLG